MKDKLNELQSRINKVQMMIENVCMSTCDYIDDKSNCRECINFGYVQILEVLQGSNKGDRDD